MNKTSLIASAALAMALGACSKEQPAPAPSETATQAPVVEALEIPESLRGRWGLVPADCTSTAGDAKGLMTVGEDKLEFYESVAQLGPIKEVGDDSISASYQFTGEGQSWIREVALSTPDGGKTLVREDTGPDASPEPLTYRKCP
ncbi:MULTISPECIES: hypothetical protein [Novosphingobium]|uniref:Protease inhibitor Inh n=1 Tax=Novosphingobium mathurense TaxID=428990 RepID=A0A1U6GU86_9SPHN|nr:MULTISPECIES: hypothetical protein [Novosphingobium]CDO35382.1 conserved exported hypothetical protein [Novosphingobium sp. KN65.2]SLJ87101.1 hypothetical protein SAMN06295987_101479 [Novosphingobium mathurense]